MPQTCESSDQQLHHHCALPVITYVPSFQVTVFKGKIGRLDRIPCLRSSSLNAIYSGVAFGLATYAFTSNIQRANLFAASAFSVVLCTNWILCRSKYVDDRHSMAMIQSKMMDYIKNRNRTDDADSWSLFHPHLNHVRFSCLRTVISRVNNQLCRYQKWRPNEMWQSVLLNFISLDFMLFLRHHRDHTLSPEHFQAVDCSIESYSGWMGQTRLSMMSESRLSIWSVWVGSARHSLSGMTNTHVYSLGNCREARSIDQMVWLVIEIEKSCTSR